MTFESAEWTRGIEGEIHRYLNSLPWVTNGNSFGAYCVDPRLSDQSLGNSMWKHKKYGKAKAHTEACDCYPIERSLKGHGTDKNHLNVH